MGVAQNSNLNIVPNNSEIAEVKPPKKEFKFEIPKKIIKEQLVNNRKASQNVPTLNLAGAGD